MDNISFLDKKIIARLYSIWIILWWFSMFTHHALIHSTSVVFIPTDVDYTFVLLNNFGLLRALIHNTILCYIIDYSIIIVALLSIIYPCKGYLYIILLFFLSLFELCYAVMTFHHSHGLYGLVIMALPFCFSHKEKIFPIIWHLARYIPICVYVNAFFWKIKGGALFHPMQALAVVESNLSSVLVYYPPSSYYVRFIAFFIRHSDLLQSIYTIGLFIEGIFIIGCFTKKFDFWLVLLAVLLHFFIVVFVDAYFIWHCIILLPLVPIKKIRFTLVYKLLSRL